MQCAVREPLAEGGCGADDLRRLREARREHPGRQGVGLGLQVLPGDGQGAQSLPVSVLHLVDQQHQTPVSLVARRLDRLDDQFLEGWLR